jgi:hypothetical protein
VGEPSRFSITPQDAVRPDQNAMGSKAGVVVEKACGRSGVAQPVDSNSAKRHRIHFTAPRYLAADDLIARRSSVEAN